MKEKLLVSACMLGACCRYDGKSKPIIAEEKLKMLLEKYEIIPVCPEAYGGLPTPRSASEISGNRVVMKDGRDVTENFERGAKCLLDMALTLGAKNALLKERSPSCGYRLVYDGSFSGKLKKGQGVFARLLTQNGFKIYTEYDVDELIAK